MTALQVHLPVDIVYFLLFKYELFVFNLLFCCFRRLRRLRCTMRLWWNRTIIISRRQRRYSPEYSHWALYRRSVCCQSADYCRAVNQIVFSVSPVVLLSASCQSNCLPQFYCRNLDGQLSIKLSSIILFLI